MNGRSSSRTAVQAEKRYDNGVNVVGPMLYDDEGRCIGYFREESLYVKPYKAPWPDFWTCYEQGFGRKRLSRTRAVWHCRVRFKKWKLPARVRVRHGQTAIVNLSGFSSDIREGLFLKVAPSRLERVLQSIVLG